MKDIIYRSLPNFCQNILISLFNILAYRKRYGGNYTYWLNKFLVNRQLSLQELQKIQSIRYENFIKYVKLNSTFYKNALIKCDDSIKIDCINNLPILDKETLRSEIHNIRTIKKSKGIISKTGGTTGKSLEVVFTKNDTQERFAMLDDFRSRFGYKLGKKTAWFSGKSLLTQRDIKKNRFWKTDFLHNVRYYSTFHIKEDYLKYYLQDLIKYRPEYLIGFPSSIMEIAKYGIKMNYSYPENTAKAIFPTAETITSEMRTIAESFFKTKMYDQYASSEGAPFIFECFEGNLHLELQSGVFEVLDEKNIPCKKGRLIVTSFTTHGTPLVRYDIGDSVELSTETCCCGNNNPLIKQIFGRVDDFIYSPETGKINLGNISNTLKDTKGIMKFQVIQEDINSLEILVVIDNECFNKKIEKKFIQNWTDRVGLNMNIKIKYVNKINLEKSGKYRIVKNKIKHLIKYD